MMATQPPNTGTIRAFSWGWIPYDKEVERQIRIELKRTKYRLRFGEAEYYYTQHKTFVPYELYKVDCQKWVVARGDLVKCCRVAVSLIDRDFKVNEHVESSSVGVGGS